MKVHNHDDYADGLHGPTITSKGGVGGGGAGTSFKNLLEYWFHRLGPGVARASVGSRRSTSGGGVGSAVGKGFLFQLENMTG